MRSRLTLTTSGCLEDKQNNNNNNKYWERVIARKQLLEKARSQVDQERRKRMKMWKKALAAEWKRLVIIHLSRKCYREGMMLLRRQEQDLCLGELRVRK